MFNVRTDSESSEDRGERYGLNAQLAPAALERRWNGPAETMAYFHNRFKSEFDEIYTLADGAFEKKRMSLLVFLRKANQLVQHLTAHHTIEERHIFPVLATRMHAFRDDEVHIKSHEKIHEGLDQLGALIRKWRAEPSSYSPKDMRDCLDSWREVLYSHLDDEVKDLSAENMKKYWTLQELSALPL